MSFGGEGKTVKRCCSIIQYRASARKGGRRTCAAIKYVVMSLL